MALTLSDLDSLTLEKAQALSFAERDQLLDQIISDGRKQSTDRMSHRVGLYCELLRRGPDPHAQNTRCEGPVQGHHGVRVLMGSSLVRRPKSSTGLASATFRQPSKLLAPASVGWSLCWSF